MSEYSNINRKRPELLAPAGNIESFYGVLRAGADAVYLAGNKFGARAYADNFTEEQIISCIKYAHLYGKKVYLTVNTLIKNSEIGEIVPFIEPLYNDGLDGVIIQDIGVFKVLADNFPGLELHASTQMTITGTDGALFAKSLGACRIVPARELTLSEIKEIKKNTGLSLECFIHGAMCYSYSGACLFSSVIGKRSGNRGRCAQPCRLPYFTENRPGKEIYPLSLKDMCTVDILPELINAGIDSFKIEGRMKKPEYAAGVTAVYRKYIDEYLSTGRVKVTKEDRNLLENLYIRSEISEGYYHRYNGKEMVTYSSPSYNGASDLLLDSIRKNYLGERPLKEIKKINITFSASFVTGEKAVVNASVDSADITVTVYGDIVGKAISHAISALDVAKGLGKLGDTVFTADLSDIDNLSLLYVSDDAYYPLKGINELRREAVNLLENILLKNDRKTVILDAGTDETVKPVKPEICKNNSKKNVNGFSVLVSNLGQLEEIISFFNDNKAVQGTIRIYIPEEIFFTGLISTDGTVVSGGLLDELKQLKDIEIFIACPYIRRSSDKIFRKALINAFNLHKGLLKGVLVRNWEDFEWLNAEAKGCSEMNGAAMATDFGLYVWNDAAVCGLQGADSIGLPLELNSYEQLAIVKNFPEASFEKMIYGRYPLMQSANCIRKTTDICLKAKNTDNQDKTGKSNFTRIKDRTGRYLPVYNDCMHCRNTVYNAVPFSLKNSVSDRYGNVLFRIEFTDEDCAFVGQILEYYLCGKGELSWDHTGGFEKQSTE